MKQVAQLAQTKGYELSSVYGLYEIWEDGNRILVGDLKECHRFLFCKPDRFYKTPSINEIAKVSEYFFSPETLRFFNQTLSDFSVMLTPDKTRCFVYARCNFIASTGQVFPGVTLAEYTGKELLTKSEIVDYPKDATTRFEIEEWIEAL